LGTHDLRHNGGVEAYDLGVAAHGDQGRLLVGEAGEVVLLERFQVAAADPRAVLDGFEAEAELVAGREEVGTDPGDGRILLPAQAATTGRPVAPCDDHDEPLSPAPDRTVPRSGAVFGYMQVGTGRPLLEGGPDPGGRRR
jgi:hypothetical protein